MGWEDEQGEFYPWYQTSELLQLDQTLFNEWQWRVYQNGEQLGVHFDQAYQDRVNAAAGRLNGLREYTDVQDQKAYDAAQKQMMTADLNAALATAKPGAFNVDAVAGRSPAASQSGSLFDTIASNPKFQAIMENFAAAGSSPPVINDFPSFKQAPLEVTAIIGGTTKVEATVVEDRLIADHRYDGLSSERADTLAKQRFADNLNDKMYYGMKFLGQGLAERVGGYRDNLENAMLAQGIPQDWAKTGADLMTGELLGVGALSGIKSAQTLGKLGTQESRIPKYFTEAGEPIWPPNRGFAGETKEIVLKPGTRFDRYGQDTGKFASPEGTSLEMRSLPPGAEKRPYNVYEVVQEFKATSGEIKEWFGQPGKRIQYEFNQTIKELLDAGIIREVKLK